MERSCRRNAKHRSPFLRTWCIDIEKRRRKKKRGAFEGESLDSKIRRFPRAVLDPVKRRERGREREKEQWEDKVEDEGTTQVWLNSRQRAIMRY